MYYEYFLKKLSESVTCFVFFSLGHSIERLSDKVKAAFALSLSKLYTSKPVQTEIYGMFPVKYLQMNLNSFCAYVPSYIHNFQCFASSPAE